MAEILVWLDEQVGTAERPTAASARLFGTYDPDSGYATVSLLIAINGTTYRIVRHHQPVNAVSENTAERLRFLHRNMMTEFLGKFRAAPFRDVVKKFISWNRNPAYRHVLLPFSEGSASSRRR